MLATPSKAAQENAEDFKLGRTPSSVSKRRYLDNLVTPLKPADGNAQARTPVSVSKLQFGTPTFLRRRPLAAVEEMPEYQSPEKLRRTTRRPFARGLSAIVANLRKVEESQFDEEEEAMREMEGFAPPEPSVVPAAPPAAPAPVPVPVPDVVPDSQVESQAGVRMLGGFDDEADYDSPVEEQLDRGRPMKEFKKKGQKRTTRKVNMKPTFIRRPAEEVVAPEDSDDEPVPETQVDPAAADLAGGDEDGEYMEREAGVKGKKRGADGEEKGGKVRKVARKVNELAHANFRRLKLRGKGAKGGGGGGRFRRR